MPTWQHFLVLLAPRVWPLKKSLGASKTEIQTLVKRSNFFSIKYLESDKRTLIIYFNELLSSPLERSLGFGLSVRPAKCEEAISLLCQHVEGYQMAHCPLHGGLSSAPAEGHWVILVFWCLLFGNNSPKISRGKGILFKSSRFFSLKQISNNISKIAIHLFSNFQQLHKFQMGPKTPKNAMDKEKETY